SVSRLSSSGRPSTRLDPPDRVAGAVGSDRDVGRFSDGLQIRSVDLAKPFRAQIAPQLVAGANWYSKPPPRLQPRRQWKERPVRCPCGSAVALVSRTDLALDLIRGPGSQRRDHFAKMISETQRVCVVVDRRVVSSRDFVDETLPSLNKGWHGHGTARSLRQAVKDCLERGIFVVVQRHHRRAFIFSQ